MAQQLLDGVRGYPARRELRCERVAQLVPADPADAGAAACSFESASSHAVRAEASSRSLEHESAFPGRCDEFRRRFWDRCDLVFVGMIGVDSAYHDVRKRLADLGLSVDSMKERGAVALIANQFVDAEGKLVPLAEGVPSYEPSIPVELLMERAESRQIVVDAWGEPSFGALPLLHEGIGDVLWADAAAAEHVLG